MKKTTAMMVHNKKRISRCRILYIDSAAGGQSYINVDEKIRDNDGNIRDRNAGDSTQ